MTRAQLRETIRGIIGEYDSSKIANGEVDHFADLIQTEIINKMDGRAMDFYLTFSPLSFSTGTVNAPTDLAFHLPRQGVRVLDLGGKVGRYIEASEFLKWIAFDDSTGNTYAKAITADPIFSLYLVSGTRKVSVKPTSIASGTLWYIKQPTLPSGLATDATALDVAPQIDPVLVSGTVVKCLQKLKLDPSFYEQEYEDELGKIGAQYEETIQREVRAKTESK